jgi:predicted aspartyl protease
MIPIVEGKINGKRAFFIVDTGASCSLLNEQAAHRYGFQYRSRSDEQVVGLNGQAKISLAFNYDVQIGNVELKQAVFKTRHLAELATIIRANDHIDIAGIIGADILKRYGMVIDFNSNTVCFHPRNNTASGKELVAVLP